MATIAAAADTPPSLTAEPKHSAVSPPPEQPQNLSPIHNHSSHSPKSETLTPAISSPSLFINSIAELKDLSAAITAFQICYDDLHNHLQSIRTALESKLPLDAPDIITPGPIPPLSSPCEEKPNLPEESALQKQPEENSAISELEGLCKTMCSREIRKYLITNLADLPRLREEVPKALKLAPNPPKLVLECLGKFYLQGKKAFARNSPMIPAREGSILILECFLLMMGMDETDSKGLFNIEKAVKQEADTAALAWRKRLVTEGGLGVASKVDARGLLLFVACFGIPSSFKREDFRDLVVAGNAKEIVGVLQKSGMLMNKLPEIVEGMIKHRMEVGAVDIAYTFGLEERFNPQTILVQFLRESKEPWKKQKKGLQGSSHTQNEANKKYLAALKSVIKCLERHKIDPAKLLPGWQISQKITSLEKEIADYDRRSGDRPTHKRKSNEPDTSSKKSKMQETKRSRYTTGHGPQHQNAPPVHHGDHNRRNPLDSNRPSHHHTNNYSGSSPSVVYGGPGAVLIPETYTYGGGVHGGFTVDAAGQIVSRGGAHPTYSWHEDAALIERYATAGAGQPSSVGLTSLYRAPTSVEGFAGVPNNNALSVGVGVGIGSRSGASDLYQFADSVAESESSYPRGVQSAVPAQNVSYLYQV